MSLCMHPRCHLMREHEPDECGWPAPQPAEAGAGRPTREPGVQMIATERERQMAVEGWTPEHDDTHTDGSLAAAAACLAVEETDGEFAWPNYEGSWIRGLRDKHATESERVRQLVIAGALIAAEIDRILRRGPPARSTGETDQEKTS